MSRRGWMMSHVENNVLAAKIVVSTSFDAAATALRDRGHTLEKSIVHD
jgi:hypothetical protein